MSLHRRNARRDANEPDIRDALTAVGAKYLRLSAFDLLVLYHGQIFMLEVKMPKGEIQPSQQDLVKDGWPLRFVETAADALAAIGAEDAMTPSRTKKTR